MGMTKVLFFSLGTCIVRIQRVRVNFACTNRLFNLSAEPIINVHTVTLCARCAICFEAQTNPLFLSFSQGIYIFEESPKSIRDGFEDVYCPSKYCFNGEKCESLDDYITTPRCINGCG